MPRVRYNTTLGFINNNPTNIRHSVLNKWQGQTGQRKGFCVFSTKTWAFRATAKILFKYIERGNDTIEKMINAWAPQTENNTEAYITYVCKKTHIERKQKITKYNRNAICSIISAMCYVECAGYIPARNIVELGYDLAVTEG